MVASEHFELCGIPGLHAETDAGDAGVRHELEFFGFEGARVGFHRPFFERGEVDEFVHTGEQTFEVGAGEESWGSAAEVDGFGAEGVGFRAGLNFCEQGIDKAIHVGIAGRVLVERAVRANPMAEGDVDVDVRNLSHGFHHGGW